jgi:hypothetical protein
MRHSVTVVFFAFATPLVAGGCDGGTVLDHSSGVVEAATVDDTGRYPEDISPPRGTEYPCALTALPKNLPGIPPSDREYVNRTYARILRATQAKLVLLKAMEERLDIAGTTAGYRASASKLLDALRRDSPPRGLEEFHRDVILAIELQDEFFRKTAPMRADGAAMSEIFTVPEGREASGRLIAAWGAMASRYPDWPSDTKDSIYHHLCALDFF